MHYAYILRSVADPDRHYHGSTSDLRKRLAVHNDGGNVSTKLCRPWTLAWYGGFSSEETAMDFERYLKTASGKAFGRPHRAEGFRDAGELEEGFQDGRR
jgi:putative endonuclease